MQSLFHDQGRTEAAGTNEELMLGSEEADAGRAAEVMSRECERRTPSTTTPPMVDRDGALVTLGSMGTVPCRRRLPEAGAGEFELPCSGRAARF